MHRIFVLIFLLNLTTSSILAASTGVAKSNSNNKKTVTPVADSSGFVVRDVDSYDDQQTPIALAQSQTHEQQQPQPDIKWITPSDFLELIRYLFDQAKNIPYTNFIIIDTRNSNEYNGWKSFDAIYAALDFNRTG